jgi:excisionase family DNA binding protein
MTDTYLTPAEVAAALALAPRTLRQRVRDGRLPAYKDGRRVWFRASDVDAYRERMARAAVAVRPGATLARADGLRLDLLPVNRRARR